MKVFEGTPDEYYMDGYMKSNMDIAIKAVHKDLDMVVAVDGYEGSGKSVITQQIAKYVDPSFTIKRIVFTPSTFRKAIVDAKQFQAVIYDESYTGLSSRQAMSKVNKALIQMIAEIRQKNLFVFIVCPSFFDLDKYIALHRSRALIHVYMTEGFTRGNFAFYNIDKKKDLYVNGKKFYSYFNPKPNFFGRFTNHYTVDELEYRKLKKLSLTDMETQREDEVRKRDIDNELFERAMVAGDGITHEAKAKIIGMPLQTYYYKLRAWREKSGIIPEE